MSEIAKISPGSILSPNSCKETVVTLPLMAVVAAISIPPEGVIVVGVATSTHEFDWLAYAHVTVPESTGLM